jgi:endonuclease YncB( thermonuclease family)
LRWWRRNDGFEWKEYVRTTVLVRRQHRRDKVEAAKVAAIEGVKEAGRKSLAAGAAGAEVAGQAAVKIAKQAADGASAGAERGLAAFVRGCAAMRSRIALASAPINARLASPPISKPLAVTASLAAIGFTVRAAQFGVDGDAVFFGTLAVAAGLLWIWPRAFSHASDNDDLWTVRTERLVAAADRAGTWLPIGLAVLVTGAGIWLAGPAVSRWIATATTQSSTGREDRKDAAANVELSGSGRTSGPGQLRVGGTLVRLDGLTMLDTDQTCRREDGTTWTCGAAAKLAFDKLVRGRRTVTCTLSGGEEAGVRDGTCRSGDRDIAADLVRGGHGFAEGGYWAAYGTDESAARDAKAGLWAGEPERPEDWRARLFQDASAAAPGGCPIKGRIQRSRKTYLMPHSADYARATVREDRGERWFCSTGEAEAAGFAPRDK